MTTISSTRVDLRQVTLCAVDCLNPALAVRALKLSAAQCDFADVVLFSDRVVDTTVTTIAIDPICSTQQYSEFMIRELHRYIQTPWVLVIQWDGYVVHPQMWRPEFLDYDYIGARWPWAPDGQNVGNGGFSLRSKRLLDLLGTVEWSEHATFAEDTLIARILRPTLEERYGIRFAPQSIADQFAYEFAIPDAPTFGFHSPANLWRYIGDDEMTGLLSQMDRRTFLSQEMVKLLWAYYRQRKFDCMRAMYARFKESRSRDELFNAMVGDSFPYDESLHCVELCESLL
jgi:hypothetical protein